MTEREQQALAAIQQLMNNGLPEAAAMILRGFSDPDSVPLDESPADRRRRLDRDRKRNVRRQDADMSADKSGQRAEMSADKSGQKADSALDSHADEARQVIDLFQVNHADSPADSSGQDADTDADISADISATPHKSFAVQKVTESKQQLVQGNRKSLVLSRTNVLSRSDLAETTQKLAQLGSQQVERNERFKTGAELVFRYWQAKLGHGRAMYSRDREAKIIARLRENGCDLSELCYAIDGIAKSAFHRGQNDSGQRYDSIELICRNRANIERFATTQSGYQRQEEHPFVRDARTELEQHIPEAKHG
jgi:hypothetical protein